MDMTFNASGDSILVVLDEQSTLYMRPAAMLTKIANKFEADVVLEHGKARANGKSLLEIITLGIATGGNFRIFASGKDARKAIQSIKVFFKRFFIDGEISDVLAENCALPDECTENEIQNKQEYEMKQKKQAVLKQQSRAKQVKQDKKKGQTFVWPLTENVNEVLLAGDFNNWNPEPMAKCENGFHAAVELKPGVYQYKFVVDGQWQVDPFAKGNARNDFGTTNSVLLVV
ncbi:MAG: HPr family phosphocarrier protein [Victivallales bacterium]